MTICPTTEEDWKQAEQRKSCATGIYHCLRTQLKFPIEVCAPRKTLIQASGCPYWNINGNLDMVDCRKYPECPDQPFLSNEVYKYPFCYQSWSTTTTYTTTTTVSADSTTTTYTTTTTVSADRPEHERWWFILIMATLSCAVLMVLLVFIIRYRLRNRRQKEAGTPVNDGVLSEETSMRTPFLDGQKKEEKNEIVEVNEETGFVKSDAYKEGIDVLKKDDVLIIIGSPGSGKSAMASEILSTYKKRHVPHSFCC